jgi:hypothetical protein
MVSMPYVLLGALGVVIYRGMTASQQDAVVPPEQEAPPEGEITDP